MAFESIFSIAASFIDEYTIKKTTQHLLVDYTCLPYDLIDMTLDFDEAEYIDKLRELEDDLFAHLSIVVDAQTCAVLLQRRIVFRGNVKTESKYIFEKNALGELSVMMDVSSRVTELP